MRTAIYSIAMLAFLVATSSLNAQEDKWFDMEHCQICKSMGEHPEVMMDVKFDVYPISNGMVMVMVIPEKHKTVMEQAHEHMKEAAAQMEKGKKMELCGFCKSYGKLMEAGATIEELETVGGLLTIVISSDEDVVSKIHEHAKRSHVEHEKMAKAMTAEKK